MQKLILQPTASIDAKDHFKKTIENYINLDKIKPYISNQQIEDLESIYPERELHIWGVQPGINQINVKKWERIESGDIVFFAADKKIFSSGTVTYKLKNEDIANYLWGYDEDGDTWEYIFLVDEIIQQNISYADFNKTVGYKENNIIQGFNVLDEEKSIKAFDKFGVDSKVYYPEIQTEKLEESIEQLLDYDSLDTQVISSTRVEQAALRRYLFKNKKKDKCGICNRDFPVDFLVAAHIKKRALCTKEERLDYKNIVMSMCKFGCDDLYERGYIYINEEGIIKKNTNKELTKTLEDYIDSINNTKCNKFNESTRKYFAFHKNYI